MTSEHAPGPEVTSEQIARRRGLQTLADGAIVVAVVAGIVPLVDAVASAESWEAWLSDWPRWTWTAAQGAVVAGGTAVVAWLRRRFVQPADQDAPRRALDDRIET